MRAISTAADDWADLLQLHESLTPRSASAYATSSEAVSPQRLLGGRGEHGRVVRGGPPLLRKRCYQAFFRSALKDINTGHHAWTDRVNCHAYRL